MTLLLRIADRVLNRPLLVHPDKVPLILSVLEGRIPVAQDEQLLIEAQARIDRLPIEAQQVLRGPLPDASRFSGSFESVDETGNRTGLPYRRTRNGTALIPVIGGLVSRGFSAEPSSMSKASYEALGYQIDHAEADDKTTSAILDMHTPGGEAVGAFELAAKVRRLAAKKPVTAVANGMSASAGYAIASAANRIVVTPTGVLGSIGVVLLHADYSRALDKEGITPTLIFAGAHKVDGHPFGPLSDGVKEDLQREVNAYYDLFIQTVAAGRRQMSPAMIRATEARTFIGADAVAQGLADSVGTFEEVLAELSRGSSGRATSSNRTGANMDNPKGAPVADAPGTITKADHDAAVIAARAEGDKAGRSAAQAEHDTALKAAVTTARTEGADGERTRILGIEKIAVAGHDALIAEMKADGKTSPPDAAMRILEAEKITRGKQLAAIKDVEAEGSKVKPAASSTGAPAHEPAKAAKATTPEQLKAEFDGDPKLQAEFVTAENYVAYMQAEAAGKVKRLVQRS